ncbi:hypothetical protein ACFYO2_26745 [Streptomyces sp. NPDC006602]|uniref:hypothetical protein n=1 Tax=Streptomyces sp. NPDC006602 TaxID=3364751 RepID=UPI00369C8662
MAEAKRTIVDKEVKRVEKVPGITLTLTIAEAETLIAVGAKIGGDREHSPRKHYEAVTKALLGAGVRDYTVSGKHPFKHFESNTRGLYFNVDPRSGSTFNF